MEIERKDSRGRNFLLALPVIQKKNQLMLSSEYIFPLKELLINELNADLNVTSLDGGSILCMELDLDYQHEIRCPSMCLHKNCKAKSDLKKVEVYHKTLALVISKNFAHINLRSKAGGLTPTGEAVHFFGSNLKEESLELFRAVGANFNELDAKGDTILHYCVGNCDNNEFIKLLVKYGCKINIQNAWGLCALCLVERQDGDELIKFFRKMLKLKRHQKCPLNCTKERNKTNIR